MVSTLIMPLLISASVTTVSAETADGTVLERRSETNGVELVSRINQKDFVAGGAVMVDLVLTNKGKEMVTYGTHRSIADYVIAVKDEKGDMVPLTRYGKMHLRFGLDRLERTGYVVQELAPGKSVSASANLSRLFDLTLPGKYHLTVGGIINEDNPKAKKPFELETPPLLIEVREPTPVAIPKSAGVQ